MEAFLRGPQKSGVGVLIGMLAILLAGAGAAQAAFPGQNGKISFDTLQPSPPASGFELRIDLINPDATGRAPLTGSPVNDLSPAWSADGKRIVFTRRVGTDSEIWVINADGTSATQLTTGNDDEVPAFSGDGTKVVFARNDGNPQFDNEIWVMNVDGSNQVKLTNNNVFDTNPVFSPNGARIAFDSDESAGTGDAIYVMQADGSGRTPLTPVDGTWRAGRPDWSPDGARLTFFRCDDVIEGCDVPFEIATISAAGPVTPGQETEVTSQPANGDINDFDPVYSPDGTRIAFGRQDFGAQTSDVFTVPAGGGAQPQLTSTDTDHSPDWQPISSSGGTQGKKKNPKKCRGVAVTIKTTNRPDVIIGTPGRDVVHGLRGNDVIKGKGGNDRLCGGRDVDHIYGGPGNDVIFGGDQSDYMFGGPGIDQIFGGTPDAPAHLFIDHCFGGEGHDSYRNCQRRSGLDKKFP